LLKSEPGLVGTRVYANYGSTTGRSVSDEGEVLLWMFFGH